MKKAMVLVLSIGGISWYLLSGPEEVPVETRDLSLKKKTPLKRYHEDKHTFEKKEESKKSSGEKSEKEFESQKAEELPNYKKIEKNFWNKVDSKMDEHTKAMNQKLDEETIESAQEMMNSSDNVGVVMQDQNIDEAKETEEMNESEEPYFEEKGEDGDSFSS